MTAERGRAGGDRSPRPGWTRVLALRPARPGPATAAGLAAVVVVGVSLAPLQDRVSRVTQALALVAVVIATSVLGGRRPAYVVATGATLCFMLLLPPVGSMDIHLGDDVVAVVALFVVATTVATLVSGRIEALGRVEHQRSVLLRSVSHDLRTPLSSIKAAASDLADGEHHDEASRRRLLELITHESDRLDRLVANLLSFSRIEAGALVPDRRSVDVAELVEFGTARLDRLFAGRVTVVLDVADDLPAVSVDYVLLEQVLANLLENAVRHSPPGGEVRVDAAAAGDRVLLSVTDRGPGVDPAEADAVFLPFRSGTVAGTSGIGLAICKAIVEAHGGTIAVSDVPGGGARFTVGLPAG